MAVFDQQGQQIWADYRKIDQAIFQKALSESVNLFKNENRTGEDVI